MRITGGEWKGRPVKTPPGRGTRPTPSRVREGLFNVLGDAVVDRPFYDLFAGSGIVALEALSRGASRAIAVEHTRSAVRTLRDNVRRFECAERVEIVQHKLPGWLRSDDFRPEPPLVVFVDPPYREGLAEKTLHALGETDTEWGDSLCVVQTEKGLDMRERSGPWTLRRCYKHGDSLLWLYEA